MENNGNGFNQYKFFLLKELERIDKNLNELNIKLDDARLDIQTLKTKSMVWGSIAGVAGGSIFGAIAAWFFAG